MEGRRTGEKVVKSGQLGACGNDAEICPNAAPKRSQPVRTPPKFGIVRRLQRHPQPICASVLTPPAQSIHPGTRSTTPSRRRSIHPSIHPSVRPSIRPFVPSVVFAVVTRSNRASRVMFRTVHLRPYLATPSRPAPPPRPTWNGCRPLASAPHHCDRGPGVPSAIERFPSPRSKDLFAAWISRSRTDARFPRDICERALRTPTDRQHGENDDDDLDVMPLG
ncbi:hypothetical protein BDK51DRAFT_36674 [Blyttiomyces helicus]|uniref:Uncharacterized protein n=1 Tax=Blyttiomyces helicus TaxID=388810 RepID=A0A4P9W994_9FUNG|nr:hypothetical protein BDK51DRAFT_36674 [Blyttiomyces helicus]|eukprot:RKO89119.1 hypothetical protein BDK51DRAFT_36674 [Blyttiomyces helicus]